jgi:hypothetical protein
MAMAMTVAGMSGHEFRQIIGFKEFHIFINGSLLCLKHSQPGAIEFMERSATDPANQNCINLMSAQSGNGIAGAMLVNLVAVVDRSDRPCVGIYDHKHRCGAKMVKNLTRHPFIFLNRKTDFHLRAPFVL